MKNIPLFLFLSLLFCPNLVLADRGVTPFTNLDDYIKAGKSIFIGECLSLNATNSSESGVSLGVKFIRRLKVIKNLQGPDKIGDTVENVSNVALVPGHYYLICADVDEKGAHDSWFFELGEVEIRVQNMGEDKTHTEFFLKRVLSELEGKTTKEQILIIFKHRKNDLGRDEFYMKQEKEALDTALNPK